MKLSKYAIKINHSNGNVALFNTRTGSLISIDRSTLDQIESGSVPVAIKDELLNRGYIVEKNLDEAMDYVAKVRTYKSTSNKTLSVTIAQSFVCNFNCEYCFVRKDNYVMSTDIQKSVVTYLLNIYIEQEYTKLKIQWFGGEPLLQINVIENVMQELSQAIGSDNIESTIVTNGYLLSGEMYEKIVDLGINVIQVTIDSDEETHNKYRKLKSDQGTYETIINNINGILSLPNHCIINIRINYFDDNNFNVESTINDISQNIKSEKVYIQFKPILPFDESSCNKCVDYSDAEMMKLEIENRICNSGGASIKLPNPRFQWCSAGTENTLNIGPHGEIYFCKSQFGHLEKTVGQIEEGRLVINDNYAMYSRIDDLSKKCYECSFLPICMGGCKIMRKKYPENCYWSQETIEKMVLAKLEWTNK